MTAQEKDRIECAIRHIQTAVDVDPWAVEIAVEAMKTQLSAEGTTSDLISRQDAIDAMSESLKRVFLEHRQIAEKCLKALPSAQPEIEERTEKFAQNVPKEDLISRKEAIDYCYQLINVEHQQGSDEMNYGQERVNQTEAILHHLEFMPSAQPEPQWIPCKERLPEEDHWLGGSGKQFSDNVLISILNSDDEDEWVDVSHTIDGEWTLELPRYCKILAWMPLPEPYRAERRTDVKADKGASR